MPTHNNCLAVIIAGILLVALETGPVISQSTDVPSNETITILPDQTVSRVLSTALASSIPESSLTITIAPFVATTPQPLAPTSFTSSAKAPSFDRTPSTPSLIPLSTSAPSSGLILLSPTIPTGTGVTATLASRSSAMGEPVIPDATSASMPRLNPSFTLSRSAPFPTESPDIAITTETTDSGNETSSVLYIAIPLGSATFCAIFLFFACLMCIWCKRTIKMKTESTPKEEEGVPTEMYVLENSSKGDTLRFDLLEDSAKTFGVASTLTTLSSEQTPFFVDASHITPNQPMLVGDGSHKEALECSPEANEYVKFSRASSLPRSYHLSIKHPTHQESQSPPVMMKPARSLSSINTQEFQGKRKLSFHLSDNANLKSKVYAVPIATAGLIDQQQIEDLEQLKYTQRPTRTSSVGALCSKAAAESANPENIGNEGLYDVPRIALLRRASDNPRSRNAVAAQVQRNMANNGEPSSHYDIPKHVLAMPTPQQHPPGSQNIQSSEEHASSTVPTSTSGHYAIPKNTQPSRSFSSGYKHRVDPQTAIQSHPTHPNVKTTPSIQIPRTQAVVDPFSTYDVPKKAATLPNMSHINAQGDTSHYDVPRRLTLPQNNEERNKPFLSGMMHSGSGPHQPISDQVHSMPRFGDHNPHLPTNQEKYIPQSANASTHDYQNVHRSAEDTILDDQDSDSSSEHLYDQPPPEILEELRQMSKKRQRSIEAEVVLPSNPSQSNSDVEAPVNRNVLQKAPPPVKQKPVSKRPAPAKQL